MLTDRLTPRQFSELTDLDYEVAEFLYGAYAANHENYGKIVGGLSTYSVPLIDMFLFLYDEVQQGLCHAGRRAAKARWTTPTCR